MQSRNWREHQDFDPYYDYPPLVSSSARRGSSSLAASIPHVAHETERMLPLLSPSPSVSLHDLPSSVTSRQTFASDTPLLSVNEAGYGQSASMRLIPARSGHTSPDKDTNPSGSESASSDSNHGVQSSTFTPAFHPEAGPSNPRRSVSTTSFLSSPLNPTPTPTLPFARPRIASNHSSVRVTRIASEDSRALSGYFPLSPLLGGMSGGYQRGSMILYRLADPIADHDGSPLSPPVFPGSNRASMISTADSVLSLSSDSKYPAGMMTNTERGLVAYPYDPELDEISPDEEDDMVHDPKSQMKSGFGWRGVANIGGLVLLIAALLAIFAVFPAVQVFNRNDVMAAIVGNTRINSTGQASSISDVFPDAERRSLWRREQ
ncbi:hypothetical protein AB1N83_008931 [Pleurotus pulmonarius]|nr:hypothetical protein EYR36_012060 [Pleurotus pulmonarius]